MTTQEMQTFLTEELKRSPYPSLAKESVKLTETQVKVLYDHYGEVQSGGCDVTVCRSQLAHDVRVFLAQQNMHTLYCKHLLRP